MVGLETLVCDAVNGGEERVVVDVSADEEEVVELLGGDHALEFLAVEHLLLKLIKGLVRAKVKGVSLKGTTSRELSQLTFPLVTKASAQRRFRPPKQEVMRSATPALLRSHPELVLQAGKHRIERKAYLLEEGIGPAASKVSHRELSHLNETDAHDGGLWISSLISYLDHI